MKVKSGILKQVKSSTVPINPNWTREQKIENLLYIARILSREARVPHELNRTTERDDLYGVAAHAVIQAVDTYDPSHNTSLRTYAVSKAYWAIREYVRKNSNTPRAMYERGEMIHIMSFSQRYRSTEMTYEDIADEHSAYEEFDPVFVEVSDKLERRLLHLAIQELPARLRDVVELRRQGLKLWEIGDRIGVSETRAHQLMNRAVKQLKDITSGEAARLMQSDKFQSLAA